MDMSQMVVQRGRRGGGGPQQLPSRKRVPNPTVGGLPSDLHGIHARLDLLGAAGDLYHGRDQRSKVTGRPTHSAGGTASATAPGSGQRLLNRTLKKKPSKPAGFSCTPHVCPLVTYHLVVYICIFIAFFFLCFIFLAPLLYIPPPVLAKIP